MPKLRFRGYNEGHEVSDITVRNLSLNDTLLTESDVVTEKNDFCKNIQLCSTTDKSF